MIKADVQVRVPFHDVDVLGILWHGHYAKYFELARTQLMQNLGLDWPVLKDMGVSMPVVDLQVRYKKAIQYNDLLTVSAVIREFHFPEMIIHYEIKVDHVKHSTGSTRQIYFDWKANQSLYQVPPEVLAKLEQA